MKIPEYLLQCCTYCTCAHYYFWIFTRKKKKEFSIKLVDIQLLIGALPKTG